MGDRLEWESPALDGETTLDAMRRFCAVTYGGASVKPLPGVGEFEFFGSYWTYRLEMMPGCRWAVYRTDKKSRAGQARADARKEFS